MSVQEGGGYYSEIFLLENGCLSLMFIKNHWGQVKRWSTSTRNISPTGAPNIHKHIKDKYTFVQMVYYFLAIYFKLGI